MRNMEISQCSRNKKEILLVGDRMGKRTEYFCRAAEVYGRPVTCIGWDELREQDLALSTFIKLDPPGSSGTIISALTSAADWYFEKLRFLDMVLDQGAKIPFLNTPQAIMRTLDKQFCKKRLVECGIDTTELLADRVSGYEELRSMMKAGGFANVFLKPRFGSGAAGIIAYRTQPRSDREVIYTSMRQADDGRLYNTKKLQKSNDPNEIKRMIDELLKQPAIVERWVQKAQIDGLSFDIRAVYQYGKLDFVVARGSKSPITNLHLNNCAISAESIQLINGKKDALEDLCRRTAACFDGLNIAGIDVLVTPSGKLKIIEVNGQGDLIYQDIFHENRIYQRQIREGMKQYG